MHPLAAAVQGVWASKYNERALLSMRKVGLDFRDLRMAVLVQRVVPAAYAFVIHTHNPSTGSPDEVRANQMSGQQVLSLVPIASEVENEPQIKNGLNGQMLLSERFTSACSVTAPCTAACPGVCRGGEGPRGVHCVRAGAGQRAGLRHQEE